MIQRTLNGEQAIWLEVNECHKGALALMDRHYSRKTPGADHMGGPGEKLILITPNNDAVFGWKRTKPQYRYDGLDGIECFIFRNEGPLLSSKLILLAEEWAHEKWPGALLFTYVQPKKIKSTNPGHCFIMAGWEKIGVSKTQKFVLLTKNGESSTRTAR